MPSRSWTFALWTLALSTKPCVSTRRYGAFFPLPSLAPIVSALLSASYPGCFYRLAIHYACAWLRVSLEAHPHLLAQGSVHPLPGSIHSPDAEVVVDGLPRWEVVGK